MGLLLSKPNTECAIESRENDILAFASAAMQGWRLKMEDAHVNILGFNGDPTSALFCVFDGHGGPEVAKYCSEVFPEKLVESLKDVDFASDDSVKSALVQAYIATDDSLLDPEGLARLQAINGGADGFQSSSLNSLNVGCTAVTAFIKGSKLYVANSGDSRCIMSQRRGELLELSEDHKPELPSEHDRIVAAGGYVTAGRVNGNLNLTRCIGDHAYKKADLPHAKQIISCVPDVRVVDLATAEADFLVLACDGIWDVMDNANVINYVRKRLLPEEMARGDTSADSGRLDSMNKPPATPVQWPAEVAEGSLTRAMELTARQIVDKSLASESRFGIGCDNMSFLLVVFKNGEFGKSVLEGLKMPRKTVVEEDEEEEEAEEQEKKEEVEEEEEKKEEEEEEEKKEEESQ